MEMDKNEENIIKVYTSTSTEPLFIKPQESIANVTATNNRAEYFAEQTKKLRDEVKALRDETKDFAEKNSDVTIEDINYIKLLIDTKQAKGDYALNSDIPLSISQLNNDLGFVMQSELPEKALPSQEGFSGMFLKTDGNSPTWERLPLSISLFDTILKDHVLTYEESKGLALQGTYVYKEAIAGSRYGYPDFYNKCLEEKNSATATEVTLAGTAITLYINSNGHQFYDIADKTAIDNYFNSIGSAWFYGIDTENERVFLPRNNWFEQLTVDVDGVGDSVEAGLPNIKSGVWYGILSNYDSTETTTGSAVRRTQTLNGGNVGSSDTRSGYNFNASRSSSIYGKSNTVQPNAVKKLLYICVGNTTNYEGITDVVNQGMEILEQVAQKVNIDGTNLNTEGKSLISSLAMPSNKYIDLTLGASGSTYTAPANGWVSLSVRQKKAQTRIGLSSNNVSFNHISVWAGQMSSISIPVTKGSSFSVLYDEYESYDFRFVYAVGSESEAQ